jgi:hypothetical protein
VCGRNLADNEVASVIYTVHGVRVCSDAHLEVLDPTALTAADLDGLSPRTRDAYDKLVGARR